MSDITSDYERIEKRTRIHGNIRNGIIYFFLCLWALIVLFPFYWMVLTSVKSYGSYNAEYIPKFFTLSPTWQNYVDAFTTVSLGRYLWNTLFFTVVTTAIMLVVITLAAFAFARLNFAGKDLIFTLFLSLMMIPNELVVITNFTTITNLDLRNTFTGLILPSVTSVFYIYLLRENFAQIPDEQLFSYKESLKGQIKTLNDDRTHLRKKARTKMSDDELSKVKEQISTVSDKIRELNKEVRLCDDIAERSKVMEQNLETIRDEEEKQQRKEQKRNDKFR